MEEFEADIADETAANRIVKEGAEGRDSGLGKTGKTIKDIAGYTFNACSIHFAYALLPVFSADLGRQRITSKTFNAYPAWQRNFTVEDSTAAILI